MKTLLTSLLFVCTISCISQTKAQDIDHPQIDIYLNNYQTNRPVKTTSERSSYFAQAFYELLQTIPSFKNGLKNAEGHIKYVIKQTSIQNPLTRNNGQKIYNGFAFAAIESVDKTQNIVCVFVYDVDSNALYAGINHNSRFQKLLYANRDGLNKCAKYCRFNN